ncbi:10016_t:CDS:2, partial [Acaulospora morrowiae]
MDYNKLLENGNEYNVIVEVGKAPLQKSYKVHSVILCYRCPRLYEEQCKQESIIKTIKKPLITTDVFDVIIKFIYSGVITLENVDPP